MINLEIPKGNYVGYYWLSDENAPRKYSEQEFNQAAKTINPFIIEANLWDSNQQVSVSVRHTGRYHVQVYDLSQYDAIDEEQSFISVKNIPPLKFKALWREQADSFTLGMPVLKFVANAFVGFKSN
jgi:CRISPR type III-associated protein (TIGR04423 family)